MNLHKLPEKRVRLQEVLSVRIGNSTFHSKMVKEEPTSDALSRKRKKRNLGSFPCSKCQKVFTRSDHLARHYLNHQPKEVYVCNHIITDHKGDQKTCGKTFVRKDLQERHLRRHTFLQDSKTPESGAEFQTRPPETEMPEGEGHDIKEQPNQPNQPNLIPSQKPHNDFMTSETVNTHPISGNSIPNHPVSVMAFPPPPEHVPVRPLQMSQDHFPMNTPVFTENFDSTVPLKYQQARLPRPPLDHQIVRPEHQIARVGPLLRSEQLIQQGHLPVQDYLHRHDSLTYYGMQSPVQNKQDLRSHNAFPQSQNDIFSWLFTESPPNETKADVFSIEQVRPNGHIATELKPHISHEGNFTVPLPNSDNDLLLNMGLQDLNFFSNGNNPLDTAMFENSDLSLLRPDRSMVSLPTSTGSSNSPSNTTDSFTPVSIGEGPSMESDAKIVTKKLELHLKRNSPLNTQFFVDHSIVERMIEALPQLSREAISSVLLSKSDRFSIEDRLSYYLFSYWESFSPQFSIIHRVSFDTKTCEPLLLLSMILIGCMYFLSCNDEFRTHDETSPEYKLAIMIAAPLRFALFQHKAFKSPVELWILQSLNLLEWCEKNYLPREMHERAHIHHGTTVQLLRRSPFLGGNPTVANKAINSASDTCGEEDASDVNSDVEESSNVDYHLFQKWIESESMKRVTFMTFYVDVLDYVKFRHNPQIPFYQLQLLNLPCHEDQLWDSEEVNGSFRKLLKRQRKLQRTRDAGRPLKNSNKIKPGMNFLAAIKMMMRSKIARESNYKLPPFVKSILLGGLVSIMHEMQQVDLQSKFTSLMAPDRAEKNRNLTWKNVITNSFDDWDMGHSSGQALDYLWKSHRGHCSFPVYHLVQIVGFCDINHYDIAIFAGSPRNMSVEASLKDFQIVQKKLQSIWTLHPKLLTVDELINTKSIIHCYWVLWEHLLTPLNQSGELVSNHFAYAWNIGQFSLGNLYVVSVATLVLWCNVFSVCGVESESFSDSEESIPLKDLRNYEKLSTFSAEDGYHYLFRIQNQFISELKRQGKLEDHILHTQGRRTSSVPLHSVVHKYCEILPSVELRQNISGLCFLVGTELLKCQWPIIQENAKLILNCGLRSVGKKAIQCPDLFAVETH